MGAKNWNGNKTKMANVAQLSSEASDQQNIVLSLQQLQQLLSMMPGNCEKDSNDDEADSPFNVMIDSEEGGTDNKRWIVDSGASDHMTASLNNLLNVRKAPPNFSIKLPTRASTLITHIGDIRLENGLKMMNVIHIPDFNHNLLSIHKLAKDNNFDIMFYPDRC